MFICLSFSFYQVKHTPTLLSSDYTLKHLPKRTVNIYPQKDLHKIFHRNFIIIVSPNHKQNINQQENKQIVIYSIFIKWTTLQQNKQTKQTTYINDIVEYFMNVQQRKLEAKDNVLFDPIDTKMYNSQN